MKKINKDIEIFNKIEAAKSHFDKCSSADLLKAGNSFYVDKSKTALKAWPSLYTLIKTK